MPSPEPTHGQRPYVAFWRGRRYELSAETSLKAQQQAAVHFKVKKPYEVTVMLADVVHDGASLPGA